MKTLQVIYKAVLISQRIFLDFSVHMAFSRAVANGDKRGGDTVSAEVGRLALPSTL